MQAFRNNARNVFRVGVLSFLALTAPSYAIGSADLPVQPAAADGPLVRNSAKGLYRAADGAVCIRGLVMPALGNTPCKISADMGGTPLNVCDVQTQETAAATWLIAIDVSDYRRNKAIASHIRTVCDFIKNHVRETDHVEVYALAGDLALWGNDAAEGREGLLNSLEQRAKTKQFGDNAFRKMTYISAALLPKIRAAVPGTSIVLVSDGLDESTNSAEIAQLLKREAVAKGVSVNCIATPGADGQYKGAAGLQETAYATGGTYIRLDEKNALSVPPAILAELADSGHPLAYSFSIPGIQSADDDLCITFSADEGKHTTLTIPRGALSKAIAECAPNEAEKTAKAEAAAALVQAGEAAKAKAEAEEAAKLAAEARKEAEAKAREMEENARQTAEKREKEQRTYIFCVGSGILLAVGLLVGALCSFRKKGSGHAAPRKAARGSAVILNTYPASDIDLSTPDSAKEAVDLLPQVSLKVTMGGKETHYPITKKMVTIGSSAACDIMLNDATISRNHCVLKLTPNGSWRITDTGSSNKIYAAGALHESLVLRNGDQFELGNVLIQFIQQ